MPASPHLVAVGAGWVYNLGVKATGLVLGAVRRVLRPAAGRGHPVAAGQPAAGVVGDGGRRAARRRGAPGQRAARPRGRPGHRRPRAAAPAGPDRVDRPRLRGRCCSRRRSWCSRRPGARARSAGPRWPSTTLLALAGTLVALRTTSSRLPFLLTIAVAAGRRGPAAVLRREPAGLRPAGPATRRCPGRLRAARGRGAERAQPGRAAASDVAIESAVSPICSRTWPREACVEELLGDAVQVHRHVEPGVAQRDRHGRADAADDEVVLDDRDRARPRGPGSTRSSLTGSDPAAGRRRGRVRPCAASFSATATRRGRPSTPTPTSEQVDRRRRRARRARRACPTARTRGDRVGDVALGEADTVGPSETSTASRSCRRDLLAVARRGEAQARHDRSRSSCPTCRCARRRRCR